MNRRKLLTALGASGLTSLVSLDMVAAQDEYPSRLIKIVVGNTAGGPGDIVSRAIADRATLELGKPVIIENRPGASTVIGTQYVAQSAPDGYTILSLTTSGIIQTVLRERMPYDLMRDFAPIIGVGSFPMALTVSAQSNIRTMDDLVAAMRSSDGITYASAGAGTMAQLAAVRLLNELRGHGEHIPFRGNPEGLQAVMGGFVTLMFPSVYEVPALIASGRARVLGMTGERRLPSLPDVPTMGELGFADFSPRLGYSYLAPAGTPPGIITRLHDTFARAMHEASVQDRFRTLGFETQIRGPGALSAHIREEAERWGQVIRDNNIRATD